MTGRPTYQLILLASCLPGDWSPPIDMLAASWFSVGPPSVVLDKRCC